MANQLATTQMLANKGLAVLRNDLVFASRVNRSYNDQFANKSMQIGATVNVRRPPRYIGTFGPNLNLEDTNQTYQPVSINYQFHVDAQFNMAELTLEMGDLQPNVVEPALAAVANRVDSDGLYYAYQNTAITYGTPGVTPTSFKLFSDAAAQLRYEGAPKGEMLSSILDPYTQSSMADALKGSFNPQAQISDIYRAGMVARKTAGSDWYEDANVPIWTSGALGGTPVLAGISAAAGGNAIMGSSWAQSGILKTSGWTAAAAPRLTVGDIIQIAGVFPVNPQSRSQYGRAPKQFVVLAPGGYAPMQGAATPGGPQFASATLTNGTFNAVTGVYSSTSGGLLDITVGECVITGGQFQNCTTTSAFTGTPALTITGGAAASSQSSQNILTCRDAFALAFVDLQLPMGVETAKRAKSDVDGLSIRVVSQYTINNDALPTRFDVAYGYSSLYRQLASRIFG